MACASASCVPGRQVICSMLCLMSTILADWLSSQKPGFLSSRFCFTDQHVSITVTSWVSNSLVIIWFLVLVPDLSPAGPVDSVLVRFGAWPALAVVAVSSVVDLAYEYLTKISRVPTWFLVVWQSPRTAADDRTSCPAVCSDHLLRDPPMYSKC